MKKLIICLLAFLAGTVKAQTPDFYIGVYAQPSYSFDKWKSRGINSLFQYEGLSNTVTIDQWSQSAASKGLYYARKLGDQTKDIKDPFLLAWTQLDEPDLENHNPNPSTNISIYNNLKSISSSKPVWINFAGNHVTQQNSNYTEWAKSGDWLSMDWYPYNANPTRYNIDLIGQAIDKLRLDSQGVPKKYFAIIEASNQQINSMSRAPTTGEFRAEIWEAIIHGAGGVIYFPQQIGNGFKFDAMPQNLVDEMVKQNAKITSYSKILSSERNPKTLLLSSTETAAEFTWRSVNGKDYLFVINQSDKITDIPIEFKLGQKQSFVSVLDENRSLSVVNNTFVDTFQPYELHIYSVVPEPSVLGAATFLLLLKRRTRK